MADLGFVDIEVQANGNWFDYMIQEVRRIPFMAKKYSGVSMVAVFKLLVLPMLLLLRYLNKKNNASDELLCFGYHVTSQKPLK